MNFSCASLFSIYAFTAFVAEIFPGGNLPVVVHIVAGDVSCGVGGVRMNLAPIIAYLSVCGECRLMPFEYP